MADEFERLDAVAATRPIHAEISGAALAHNLHQVLSSRRAGTHVLAPVKANAYGHGVVQVTQWLEQLGIAGVATANFDDAVAIRSAGCKLRILMYDCHLPEGTAELLRYRLTPTVCTMTAAEEVSRVATAPTAVHIKVDSGLGRLGVDVSKAARFILAVARLPNVLVEGVYTHLPFSDLEGRAWAERNLRRFLAMISEVERAGLSIPFVQAASSAALLSGLSDRFNTIAPGHALYGFSPLASGMGSTLHLQPALQSLRSRIIHVATHRPDEPPAIAGHYTTRKVRRTGVILLGLDNGWRRPIDGANARVLIRGRSAALLGVTAEYSIIDLTGLDDVAIGDTVTVIGKDGADRITIDEVAAYLGQVPVMTAVNLRRVPLVYTAI